MQTEVVDKPMISIRPLKAVPEVAAGVIRPFPDIFFFRYLKIQDKKKHSIAIVLIMVTNSYADHKLMITTQLKIINV